MKHFSFSTIFGLAFGVLLAAYAVFAFDPPSSAPPAGNVPAPLNTGTGDQTKTGGLLQVFGLWVDQSLGVTGGASFGGILDLGGNKITNVGSPSAAGDVATKGFVDSQTSNLQARVLGSCSGGQGIRAVGADGSVACETMPQGLRNTDVVAGGAASQNTWSTACNQPSDGGRRCDAYFHFWYSPWSNAVGFDPRGVLTTSFSQASMPCYETPNGSYSPCGAQRTYPTSPSFSCSGGFTADTGHVIARALDGYCEAGGRQTCVAAICRLP